MRKILILTLIPLLYLSCSKEPEAEDQTLELLPVTEVEFPESMQASSNNQIRIRFVRPTGCYSFNKFYYDNFGLTRTVAVESKVSNKKNGDCQALPNGNNVSMQILKFKPEQPGEYVLKFWKGKDANGDDLFLTYTVAVE